MIEIVSLLVFPIPVPFVDLISGEAQLACQTRDMIIGPIGVAFILDLKESLLHMRHPLHASLLFHKRNADLTRGLRHMKRDFATACATITDSDRLV